MKTCALQNGHVPPGPTQCGFTYIEVMLSAVLLAVLVVPALQALQTGVSGGPTPVMAARGPALSAKMEEVLSHPFPDLYAETYKSGGALLTSTWVNDSLSDAAGAGRRVVVLYRYDASTRAGSIGDTGLLYVRVYYDADGSANSLDTLAGRWW